jgi:anti-sigma regulatory factor (Ser/Thr protein kinase)
LSQPSVEKIVISNNAQALSEANAWLEEVVSRFDITSHLAFKIDLVMSEVLPNIISYGYFDDKFDQIELTLEQHPQLFILQITDQAIPFNPFTYPEYKQSETLEEASIGGRGIHLMKSFSDAQEYQYDSNMNITRFSFLKASES